MVDGPTVKLKKDDLLYPKALFELANPPAVLTTSGPLEPRRAVAIVGSREATPDAAAFAHDLAFQLAKAGILVVSGGATGIDAAAHRGAIAAGGATWVVSPTGKNKLYPPEHAELFETIAGSADSRMLWPFPDDQGVRPETFLYRNGVLAALSETLVVVQARYQSGSRNATTWARSLGRTVWAMTAAPWMAAFCGGSMEIEQELARPLCSSRQLFTAMGLGEPAVPPQLSLAFENGPRTKRRRRNLQTPPEPPETGSWTSEERTVFSATSMDPVHIDRIIDQTGLQVPPVVTALLTLRLKDVVVEGPDGFFRRKTTR